MRNNSFQIGSHHNRLERKVGRRGTKSQGKAEVEVGSDQGSKSTMEAEDER